MTLQPKRQNKPIKLAPNVSGPLKNTTKENVKTCQSGYAMKQVFLWKENTKIDYQPQGR